MQTRDIPPPFLHLIHEACGFTHMLIDDKKFHHHLPFLLHCFCISHATKRRVYLGTFKLEQTFHQKLATPQGMFLISILPCRLSNCEKWKQVDGVSNLTSTPACPTKKPQHYAWQKANEQCDAVIHPVSQLNPTAINLQHSKSKGPQCEHQAIQADSELCTLWYGLFHLGTSQPEQSETLFYQ